ncbi:D-glucosaminate-6-phosphate ammonia lyase [Erwinia aphidicola]|uniref:D-glucosaminate-6-phosphate ammonia lyase n=1 Tax=Erwinia aphidicola TaxID=68334 RepID=UPI0030175DFC
MTGNIYQSLGLKRVINACGKMTILGVSSVPASVMAAVAQAAGSFVEIDALVDRVGERVSEFTGGQDSYVTSCATAGIAIAVAAAVSRGEPDRVAQLPDSSGMANEVVMLRGHNVDYGASIMSAIRLGGGRIVEVGHSNLAYLWQLEKAVTPQTAALLYVKSHHAVQKGMLTLETFVEVARSHRLPLIVDAAAEEDLRRYVAAGADMVIYSGAKAFNAPTSGFITGGKQGIGWCKAQHNGIARAMKIGKENMVGLVKALELYHQDQNHASADALLPAVAAINALTGFAADIEQDEAGRAIWRIRITVDAVLLGLNAREVVELLHHGDIAIYPRCYALHLGVFSLDPRTLAQGELSLIVDRLAEIAKQQGE